MRGDRERLLDIVEAIERIRRHTTDEAAFAADELVQTWVLRHLEIIGEAAGRISDRVRNRHPEVPWTSIVALRNVVAHDYFEIDTQLVWRVVERDLDPLEQSIRTALDDL